MYKAKGSVLLGQTIKIQDQGKLEMSANAQHDGRPAEYRWCPLFNAENFG